MEAAGDREQGFRRTSTGLWEWRDGGRRSGEIEERERREGCERAKEMDAAMVVGVRRLPIEGGEVYVG